MTEPTQYSIYNQIGPEAFERLIHAFYMRVATDPILRPMYPEGDLEQAERRLRLFMEQFFGGPRTYEEERGHPRLRLRHVPFTINQEARDAWVRNMVAALDEANIPEPARTVMRGYFERTATFLMNTDMPD